jgi:hypothetical protein
LTRRRDLDFNAELNASFPFSWVVLIGTFQLLIYQIQKMLILLKSLSTWTRVKILASNDSLKNPPNKDVHSEISTSTPLEAWWHWFRASITTQLFSSFYKTVISKSACSPS